MITFEIEPGCQYSGHVLDAGYTGIVPGSFGYVVRVTESGGVFAQVGDTLFVPRHLAKPQPRIPLRRILTRYDKVVGF